MMVAAGLLSQCASGPAKGKEAYGELLPAIRAPQSLDYAGLTYTPGYSAVNQNGVLVEYFPAGQGPKQWSQMLALRSIEKKTTPEQEVGLLATMASARGATPSKQSDAGSSDHAIDFTLPKGETFEFNVFRYSQAGEGTTSLQYAAILPPQTVQLGSGALRAVADKHRAAIMRMPMPEVGRQGASMP
jgi:hypothetical protein